MKTLYSITLGYALLASGCMAPQCLPDCAERTRAITADTQTCRSLAQNPITPNSREHARFNRHFKRAIEHALGAPPYAGETYFQLDPDHFERHRDAVIDLSEDVKQLQPWLYHAYGITYERTEERPPYRPYTQHTTPATLADILRHTRPPRRKTILGEIGDTLHGLFGWIFIERLR